MEGQNLLVLGAPRHRFAVHDKALGLGSVEGAGEHLDDVGVPGVVAEREGGAVWCGVGDERNCGERKLRSGRRRFVGRERRRCLRASVAGLACFVAVCGEAIFFISGDSKLRRGQK